MFVMQDRLLILRNNEQSMDCFKACARTCVFNTSLTSNGKAFRSLMEWPQSRGDNIFADKQLKFKRLSLV